MVEDYDPGEGPSNGNLQHKCSICDFATYNREEIIQHLNGHILGRNNSSTEVINMALSQLRHYYEQTNPPRTNSSVTDGQEDNNSNQEEPGVLVPRVNSQGRVKVFSCKTCDFKAVTKLEYWNHIRVHIKPNKIMACYKCPFVTEYKHHLEYHLLNHTGSKPYKCDTCSYTCVNKSMLNSHLKSHSNVYQYRCNNCEYATKYCHTLKQHLRKYRHEPAAVLNVDGTLSPMVIDVYGTRRGPKQRPKNSNGTSKSTATATATTTGESSPNTSTATQTLDSENNNSSSSDSENHVQQSTSSSPQTLQSTSTQALPSTSSKSVSTSVAKQFAFGVLANMLNNRKNNNLVIQKDEQTGQETVHYPFQYNHQLFNSLNTVTKQLLPNGYVVSKTPTNNEEEQDLEDAGEEVVMTPGTDTATADESELLESSTTEDIPLDLTLSSLRNETSTSELPCQPLPLNLANSPKVAGTRRRKGVAIKLEHRVVEKEEDTDEETTQSEKRLCQLTSPQTASAPTTSFTVTSASSTSPQAASIPSTSFMTASTPSTSLMAASAPTAPSSSENSAVGGTDSAEPNNRNSSPDCLCPHCNIPFPSQAVCIAHTRYHSSDPFTCNMCSTPCGDKFKFNLHIFERCAFSRKQ